MDEMLSANQKIVIFFLFLQKDIRYGQSLEVPCSGTIEEHPHSFHGKK